MDKLHDKNTNAIELKIDGMDCAEEIATLKREIAPLVGGEEFLSFDILNAKMTINSGRDSVLIQKVLNAIQKTGMKAKVLEANRNEASEKSWLERYGRKGSTLLSGGATLTGVILHIVSVGNFFAAFGTEGVGQVHEVPLIVKCFYLIAIVSGASYVAPKALYSLKKFRPDMNLLMMIAVIGAISIGEWFEAATVTFLFSFSLLLESWSIERARKAIETLLALAPTLATVRKTDGTVIEVNPKEVSIGAILLIKPGEKIPLDGNVVAGTSYVNQAPITGESMPVEKKANSVVFAGTINGDGSMEVSVTKEASDTTLSHIVRIISEAQSKKGSSEQWVEKFARIYTPLVLALALFVLVVPPLFFSADWSIWLYRSLVLLVIACPCALVISTPVSIVSSLAAAARNGVLIKGGKYIEAPARIQAIAMDKTGTLTEGKPKVLSVTPLSGHTEEKLLELASGMEANSDHPLAKAIVAFASQKGIKAAKTKDFRILQGKGATATIDGEIYWIGSHRFLEEKGQETKAVHEQLVQLSSDGRSVVVIGNQNHVCGFISLADSIRESAREVISQLHALGVRHISMLTGDNLDTAKRVADETGVDEVRAELLPADKVAAIEKLEERFGSVAMVGDGINDAPALARSTLGIAMGAAGSDTALETADVALMADDLSKLPWLIQHSRRTLGIIRQNIVASLLVKGVFVLLTFLGYSSLWGAIAADMGASLAVVFNSLRLMKLRSTLIES